MSSARDDILRVVCTQQRRDESHPAPWELRRQFANLADRFTESLTRVHGEVLRAESLDHAANQLGGLLDTLEAQRIVVNDEPLLRSLQLTERWPERAWFFVEKQSANALRDFCARADVGLSGGMAALAETGSLVVQSGPGLSRQATLLPPVHVALIPTSLLVSDIFAWASNRTLPFPACVTIITGPSKTADIEQTLAIGVHGPKRFIVILYQD